MKKVYRAVAGQQPGQVHARSLQPRTGMPGRTYLGPIVLRSAVLCAASVNSPRQREGRSRVATWRTPVQRGVRQCNVAYASATWRTPVQRNIGCLQLGATVLPLQLYDDCGMMRSDCPSPYDSCVHTHASTHVRAHTHARTGTCAVTRSCGQASYAPQPSRSLRSCFVGSCRKPHSTGHGSLTWVI